MKAVDSDLILVFLIAAVFTWSVVEESQCSQILLFRLEHLHRFI